MFNATAARTAVQKSISADSDLFAAELEDRFVTMTLTQRQALMRKLRDVVADEESATAFAAGTYAQAKDGSPAKALDAGSPTTPKQRLADALSDLGISPGQIQGVLRIVNAPDDPGHIDVQDDGTPTELAALRTEAQTAKADQKKAEDELAKEKAKKPAPATDVVAKAKLQPHITAAQTELGKARKNPVGGGYGIKSDDHKALQDAIASLASLAS